MQTKVLYINGVKKNNNAVTPVVSIILALLIVTSAMGTILLWGVPYIENLRSETALKNAEMQFNIVVDGIGDLINSDPGDKTITPLAVDEGSISVDKDESDRTILLYSYNPAYNFTVSGLNDSDNSFWLTMINGGVTRAEVYWLDDGGTCFLAGTKVAMGDGSYKNIESVQIGDRVKSYDEQTGEIIDCKVTHVFHHSTEEMTDYYLVINNNLRVTPNHRFYSDGNWVEAGDLRIGDPLFPREEDKEYNVYSIDRIYERATSFDLEVERCHTYFVSIDNSVDVLVHNAEGDYIESWYTEGIAPFGITTDGTYIWVVDVAYGEVYVYDMYGDWTGWSWHIENYGSPLGITTDGTNIWITDDYGEVYVYDMWGAWTGISWSTWCPDPRGITTDGEYIWIVDGHGEVYVYLMDGMLIDWWPIFECVDPFGITTYGNYFWITDIANAEVYKYEKMDEFYGEYTGIHWDTVGWWGNTDPFGMTTDGINIWITDLGEVAVYKIGLGRAKFITMTTMQQKVEI